MINNSVIKLEDNNDYIVIDKINLENKAYIYLTNINDVSDFCVRKEIMKLDDMKVEKHFLEGLTEEEFDEAMKLFCDKHKDEA